MSKSKGTFIVFESASKCGKSTLANLLTIKLSKEDSRRCIIHKRGALSTSIFARAVMAERIIDLGYSTAFYWADTIFDTFDTINPALQNGGRVIQERYDLSIVAYREIHGLKSDMLLLRELLERGFLINPDLTIFLKPKPRVAMERIRQSEDSTSVDRMFLDRPERFLQMQRSIETHLVEMNRRYVALDTGEMSPEECIRTIHEAVSAFEGGR